MFTNQSKYIQNGEKTMKNMEIAIALAQKAYKKDEVPIGAVIVHKGKVIAKAYNKREHSNDATAHAEILAIKKRNNIKKEKNLSLESNVVQIHIAIFA